MLEVNDSDILKLKKTLILKNILDEAYFALDYDTGLQYDLTEMEYKILDTASQNKNFKEILQYIISEYAVDFLQARSDLIEYFSTLAEAGLISKC